MLRHFEKITLHHCQPWDLDCTHWIFEINWHWHTFPQLSFFIFLNFQKSYKCCIQRSVTRLDKDFLRHCALYGFMPPTSPRAPRVCLGFSRFPRVNFEHMKKIQRIDENDESQSRPKDCSVGRRPLRHRSRRCSRCGSCRSSWTNRSPMDLKWWNGSWWEMIWFGSFRRDKNQKQIKWRICDANRHDRHDWDSYPLVRSRVASPSHGHANKGNSWYIMQCPSKKWKWPIQGLLFETS